MSNASLHRINEGDDTYVDATKTISALLWNAFEYASPEAPGYIARVVMYELEHKGFKVIRATTKGEHE